MSAFFDAQKFLKEKTAAASADRDIYTVARITREIRSMLEHKFGGIWLEGEISNFKRHQSGHLYFSLKDEHAQITAAMFKNAARYVKFDIEDGQKVLVFGKVSVYEVRGNYQIIVEHIEPRGLGALQLAFMQMKEKLEKEGLFDERHKKPIPFIPQKIAIVTSPTGAAIRDMINVISRRFPKVEILLYPVRVQGDGAKDEIARAIADINRWELSDVIIAGRGGGSLEDLWAFNEEIVARAIFASEIPVISAVGHEIDFTIADLVADLRAPTPSAAAELVVPRLDEIIARINGAAMLIRQSLEQRVKRDRQRLLRIAGSHVFTEPLNRIRDKQQYLDDITGMMENAINNLLKHWGQKLQSAAGKLESLSPLKVLGRGYTVTTTENGTLLRSANTIKNGERIISRFADGTVHSSVEKVIPEVKDNGKEEK